MKKHKHGHFGNFLIGRDIKSIDDLYMLVTENRDLLKSLYEQYLPNSILTDLKIDEFKNTLEQHLSNVTVTNTGATI
tara:strand:+ start:108 stop:338 length:231 start_codon:yes stop_codon:yes gene_type:complete